VTLENGRKAGLRLDEIGKGVWATPNRASPRSCGPLHSGLEHDQQTSSMQDRAMRLNTAERGLAIAVEVKETRSASLQRDPPVI
jgi:hypothetical protein